MSEFAPYTTNRASFIIKNINATRKTITVFNCSIQYGTSKNLISLPGISEDDIRASLLKGELHNKILAGDIAIIYSNIDLLQFSKSQNLFLQDAGIVSGLDVTPYFANINALSQFDDSELPGGAFIYVQSVRCNWTKNIEADPGTADGITIVRNLDNTATWYRVSNKNPYWQSITSWAIDEVNGNDENNGDLNNPIKTWPEFTRRISEIKSHTTVSILNNMSYSITGSFEMRTGKTLIIQGVPTVIATGSTTIFTSIAAATNSRGQITCAEIPSFTNYVGKLARVIDPAIVSPTVNEFIVPILKTSGLDGYIALTSAWARASLSNTTPTSGKTLQILTLPTVPAIQLYTTGSIQIRYLDIVSTNINEMTSINRLQNLGTVPYGSSENIQRGVFFGCIFRGYFCAPATQILIGCLIIRSSFIPITLGSILIFIGGGCIGSIFHNSCGTLTFQGFVIQTGNLSLGSVGFAGNTGRCSVELSSTTLGLGIFDSPDFGVALQGPVTLAGRALWGSGNTTYGFIISAGAIAQFDAGIIPTITGTSGDILFDGATTAIPPLTAGGAVPAASALTTWSHWTSAPFSRNVMSYFNGTRIGG